jgi:hypothetical protein
MLPMPVPMMEMEITDDLPGLCISYPVLFRPYPNAVLINGAIDREASISAPWRFVV